MVKKFFIFLLFLSLIAVPNFNVSAIPPGVGVLGDSATQPYQCIGRGDATSFTWTEILARLRNIDFGGEPCEPYNQAWSGETVALNMSSQVDDVLDDFNSGHIGRVIIFLGHNDLYGNPNTPNIPSVLAVYRTQLERLLNAGIAPGDILIVDVSQENWDGPIKAYVDQFNLGLRNLSIEKGTRFTSWVYFHTEAACRSTDGGNTYNIGGQTIAAAFGDEYHHWRVGDGHLGTLANGVFANALFTDFLGVPRMTDAELLSLVNGQVVPSNPPPSCSPAPTLTPLPVGSFTATLPPTGTVPPTSTFTPTITGTVLPTFTSTATFTSIPSSPTTTRTPTATASSAAITIGETSVLSITHSGNGNRLIAQQVTLSLPATIQSLSYYVATTGGQLRLGIYNNAGSNPGSLVAQTAAFTPVAGWNTQPVLAQTLLPSGTYWLAFLPQNNTLAGRVVPVGTGRYYSYTFGTLPGTFSTSVTSDTFHFSMYATLSTGTAPSSTPTVTALPSHTPSSTSSPTSTPTNGVLPSNTPSSTPLPVNTPTHTLVPSNTPTNTSIPSQTPSNTSLPSFTPSATSTNTPTRTPSPTVTPSRTPTNTLVPGNTPTRTPTSSTPGSFITIGETNVLGMSYSGMGNRLIAQQVTLSQSATIQSLSYYVSTTGGQLRLGIYNNSGSNPGTLIAQTAAFTPVTGWNTQPVLTPTALPAGTYWLVFLPQNSSLAGRVTLSGTGRHYSYTFGALPGTFSSAVTSDSFHFSFYATLSVP